MKKYFMGTIALLMAFAFTAFKQIQQDNVTLVFQGSSTSSADVADEELYQQGSASCDGENIQPCVIVTDIANTKLIGPMGSQIRVLDPAKVTLNAIPSVGGNHYPTRASGGTIAVTNKE
jgi:hypothetical protein